GIEDGHYLAQWSMFVMVRQRLALPRLIDKLSSVDGVAAEEAVDSPDRGSSHADRAEEVSRDLGRSACVSGVINAGEHNCAQAQAKTYWALPEKVVDED